MNDFDIHDCDHCLYFQIDEKDQSVGQCLRYAPRPGIITKGERPETVWPIVWTDYWCGEWKVSGK